MENLPNIPGYNIQRMIGQGGMATVYLAEQVTLHRLVALKIMSPALLTDETFTSRFLKEGATSANLFHPKIIKVFDSGVHEHHYYMAMEYLSGGTLKDKIGNGLPPKTALSILRDMADALQYAHAHDVVHRDIKSQNILLYEDGTPVLSDFGVAKALGSNTALTRTGIAVGSPGYMSPEQLRGQAIDGRTDVYALGVLFYEMLTGELPYQATDQFAVAYKHIYDPIPKLPLKYAAFQSLLDQALAKQPEDRLESAAKLLELIPELEANYEAQQSGETQIGPSGQHQFIDPPPGFKKYIVATACVLVLCIAAWIYYQNNQSGLSEPAQKLFNTAKQQHDKGDYQTSLNTIAKALQIEPDAKQLINLHRQVLNLLAEQQSRSAQAAGLFLQAQAARNSGNLTESMRLSQQGLALDSSNQDLQALVKKIQQTINEQQQQVQVLLEQAQELGKQNDYSQALAKLEEAAVLNPTEPLLQQLNTLRQTLQTQQAAAEQQARLVQQVQALTLEARSLFNRGDFDASLAKINRGLKLQPQSDGLTKLQQQVQERLADLEREREERERQLAREQQERERQQLLLSKLIQQARTAQNGGQFEDSLTIISQGLKLDKENAELLSLQRSVEQAIQQRQADAARLLQQAQQSTDQNQLSAGLAIIEQALALQPSDPELSQLRTLRQQIQTKQATAQQAEKIAEQVQNITKQALALRDQGRLEQSLATLNEGLLITNNAPELRALQEEISTQYTQIQDALRLAQAARNNKDFERSLALLELGLSIAPQSRDLITLRAQIENDITKRQDQIIILAQEAEDLYNSEDYEASLARIDEALNLTPSAARRSALEALQQEVQSAQSQAQQLAELRTQIWQAYQQAEYEQSLALIAKALELSPEQSDLLRLQTEISKAEEDAVNRQATQQQNAETEKMTRLLQTAARQLEQNRLTVPSNDNAFATFQQILAINPDNSEAKQGLEQIADRYVDLAQSRKNRGNYNASLDFIQRGLGVVPDHSKLLALRSEVQSLQEQARAANAAAEAARRERERERREAAARERERQQTNQTAQDREAAARERERQQATAQERARQQAAAQERARQQAAAQERARQQNRSNNRQQIASLNAQINTLQKQIAGIQQTRSAKSCDYYERLYGSADMTVRQLGCPRYSNQINKLKQQITQLKRQISALN